MIKIVVLLCTLIFIISYIQSFFPPERTKKTLGRFHGITANIFAALLGTVTTVYLVNIWQEMYSRVILPEQKQNPRLVKMLSGL